MRVLPSHITESYIGCSDSETSSEIVVSCRNTTLLADRGNGTVYAANGRAEHEGLGNDRHV